MWIEKHRTIVGLMEDQKTMGKPFDQSTNCCSYLTLCCWCAGIADELLLRESVRALPPSNTVSLLVD